MMLADNQGGKRAEAAKDSARNKVARKRNRTQGKKRRPL
jgi:hypothetical protein